MKQKISWQLSLRRSTAGVCPYLDVWRHMIQFTHSAWGRGNMLTYLFCSTYRLDPNKPIGALKTLLFEPETCHVGTPLSGFHLNICVHTQSLSRYNPDEVRITVHMWKGFSRNRLTVLWKTTLWPLPTLSMWVERLRQMALWRMASMVWASKKSWGLAGGR